MCKRFSDGLRQLRIYQLDRQLNMAQLPSVERYFKYRQPSLFVDSTLSIFRSQSARVGVTGVGLVYQNTGLAHTTGYFQT